jgi:two-component system sensor histidine kinase PilS (NtrC family)
VTGDARKLVVLMAARVLLVTLTLGAVVLLHTLSQRTQELGEPFGWFLSGLIVAVYLASIAYFLLLPRVHDYRRFGALQLGGDIFIITALVHVTGGAESGFAPMYVLVVVAANAIGLSRRAAVMTLISCACAYVGVAFAGYEGLLPAIIGQPFVPWETTLQSATRAVLLNLVALGATALLASNLAEQARRAGEVAARDRATALDMKALAEDIVRSLSSGLLTLDDRGVIVTINGAALEVLGQRREALLGRRLADFAPDMTPFLDRAAHEPVRRTEAHYRRDGQIIHLGVSVSPLTDGKGRVRGRVVNFSDLTELKRKDVELKQKERLAAIGRLAAGVAHEIRNPLAAISGSIELLAAVPQADEDNQRLMKNVVHEVERLDIMINDLLAYSRPRPPELHRVDLLGLLDETLQVFGQDRSQAGVSVHLDPEPGVWAHVDPNQIRQVAWNLLRNGAEAMAEGGELRVRLLKAAHQVGFEVTDAGPGIAPEDVERVFDPFFTTKDRGTGLGLATVHRIVEDHGGRVELESELGQGTTVRVWFTAAPAAAGGDAEAAQE